MPRSIVSEIRAKKIPVWEHTSIEDVIAETDVLYVTVSATSNLLCSSLLQIMLRKWQTGLISVVADSFCPPDKVLLSHSVCRRKDSLISQSMSASREALRSPLKLSSKPRPA